MATRSTIAMEREDGVVAQVYCHWDGYLGYNGMILLGHYSDPAKVAQLIALGDLSVLAPEIGEAHDFNSDDRNVCTFYGRDRGETGTNARLFRDFDDYVKHHAYEEYEYIMRNVDGKHTWFVHHDDFEYIPLTEAIAIEQEQDE